MGPDSLQMTKHDSTHMGKVFFTAKYLVLSACVVLVRVLLLCNYTLDIASYLWTDEVLFFSQALWFDSQ